MTVRLATSKDRDQVLGLLNQLGEVINELVHFDPDNIRAHELGKENYDLAIKRDDRKVFVADNEGEILGVATYFILNDFITGRPYAHIDDFIVDKNRRGQGIGTAILDFIKDYAKNNGLRIVELTSSLPLTQAHAFYESRGGKFARKVITFDIE